MLTFFLIALGVFVTYHVVRTQSRIYKIKKAFKQVNQISIKALEYGRYSDAYDMLMLGNRLRRNLSYQEEIECQILLSQFRDIIRTYNRIIDIKGDSNSQRASFKSKRKSKGYPRNAYKVLGISHPATEQQIKKAYRKLAMQHHPDKPTGSKDAFIKVEKCYDVAMAFIGAKK